MSTDIHIKKTHGSLRYVWRLQTMISAHLTDVRRTQVQMTDIQAARLPCGSRADLTIKLLILASRLEVVVHTELQSTEGVALQTELRTSVLTLVL